MEIQSALEGQYRAGLKMLRRCIELCPDDLWAAGKHPRASWRIAYHALYFTHLYLMPAEADFVPWERHVWHGPELWEDGDEGLPPVETTFSQADLMEYADHVIANVGGWVRALDLESQESGFSWYSMPKLDHQILNVRHLGIHVGQLEELLHARDIYGGWVGRG